MEKKVGNKSLKEWLNILLKLILCIVIMYVGMFLLWVGFMTYLGISQSRNDGKIVENSKEIGREVYLAPFAMLVKMENYGGWRDEYNYIFANKPDMKEASRLNEYKILKVVEEKKQTYDVNGSRNICILEDISNDEIKASLDCADIPYVNEATKFYREVSNNIKSGGRAYVASMEDRRETKLQVVRTFDRFSVFEIKSEEELKELLAPDEKQDRSYSYLMKLPKPIHLQENEVFDEQALARILIQQRSGG